MKNSVLALTKHAKSRSDNVRKKLQIAMETIELEIDKNEGIYPYRGGRLSLSEVCRRAGVHKVTLQGETHNMTTKTTVEQWIASLEKKIVTGQKSVRKTVTARADDWEAQYKALARRFNEIYAIEVIGKNKALKEAIDRVELLEAENIRLKMELSQGKVISIPGLKS